MKVTFDWILPAQQEVLHLHTWQEAEVSHVFSPSRYFKITSRSLSMTLPYSSLRHDDSAWVWPKGTGRITCSAQNFQYNPSTFDHDLLLIWLTVLDKASQRQYVCSGWDTCSFWWRAAVNCIFSSQRNKAQLPKWNLKLWLGEWAARTCWVLIDLAALRDTAGEAGCSASILYIQASL